MRPESARHLEDEAALQPDPEVVRAAAQWMARLWSDQATADDAAACSHWRSQRQEHELAWQRMQAVGQRFSTLPDAAAGQALKAAPEQMQRMRRKNLKILGAVLLTGGLAAVLRRSQTWQAVSADYASAVGQVRTVLLPDGTQLVLNTNSAVDVLYTATARRVILHFGEIMVTTGHEDRLPSRPFTVLTRDGELTPLGTRFAVRQYEHGSSVAVFEGAVEVRTRRAADADGVIALRVDAGQQAEFSSQALGAAAPLDGNAGNWVRGLLHAEQMPLTELLAELGRYRHGVLHCAPELAALRVSGVFSVSDTDRALSSLTLGLPVQLRYRTRYWVSVIPTPAQK